MTARRRRAAPFAISLVCAAAGWLAAVPRAAAEPLVPTGDAQIVEVLPPGSGARDAERQLRRRLAERPGDAALAVSLARRDLKRARDAGDPRFAGLALAALRPWSDPVTAPDDVLLLRATLQQYLHDFDPAVDTLRTLLARPAGSNQAEAWLMLATVLRVQGRYGESDAACSAVARSGADLYAAACLAENAGLRGAAAPARASFERLGADPRAGPGTQAWLMTSVAELEQREGRPAAADAAFRAALRLAPDAYATVDYADFLIEQRRPAEALRLLGSEPRTDAVLLRLAIAGAAAHAATAPADAAEMRERIALANERPEARRFHGREQAMFALAIDHDAARAFDLARGNVVAQREAIDLLVYAQAAAATGDRRALDAVRRLRSTIGLHDRRLDALLR